MCSAIHVKLHVPLLQTQSLSHSMRANAEIVMAAACSGGMCLCGRSYQPEPQACQPALPAAAVPPLPFGPLFPLSTLPSCTG